MQRNKKYSGQLDQILSQEFKPYHDHPEYQAKTVNLLCNFQEV